MHIALRDLPKRYVSVHLALYGCWVAGYTTEVLLLWIGITLLEAYFLFCVKNTPSAVHMGHSTVFGMTTASFVSSICYYFPAVLLASQSDLALFVFGVVWVMAAMATTSTMYNAVPLFFWVVCIPGFVTAFVVLFNGIGQNFLYSPLDRWLLPIGVLACTALIPSC
ncbi:MAG: hypothetical protein ACSHW1_01790 [Yoonia sp.]|uniref:hypothetical protein n=1 Tax=Yoonia sp. TaxID=2212373 RepID=UPI003EF6E220